MAGQKKGRAENTKEMVGKWRAKGRSNAEIAEIAELLELSLDEVAKIG